uniref:Uncharacterized protein n=1 Tax=Nelumbo nucifera TaxID=4432 RepID=A0A822ZSZ0_NELNU|nr:TPA_asm: hypothetical protein HUJ06_016608 [Nelumbo nucifera]
MEDSHHRAQSNLPQHQHVHAQLGQDFQFSPSRFHYR